MKLESKFDLNQKVYRISSFSKRETIVCPKCSGKKYVLGDDGTKVTCCWTGIDYVNHPAAWQIEGVLTIGLVRIQATNSSEQKVEYMCNETGVGDGRIYCEEDFFVTAEEALKECEVRNKENKDE